MAWLIGDVFWSVRNFTIHRVRKDTRNPIGKLVIFYVFFKLMHINGNGSLGVLPLPLRFYLIFQIQVVFNCCYIYTHTHTHTCMHRSYFMFILHSLFFLLFFLCNTKHLSELN